MTAEELKAHSDACFALKITSVVWLVVGCVLMILVGSIVGPLAVAPVFILTVGGFIWLQAAAETAWRRFMDGAAGILGEDHPSVQKGRKL